VQAIKADIGLGAQHDPTKLKVIASLNTADH
jgi:hypothetical protein